LNPPHTVGDAFDPTLPQCNALVYPANNEGISQLQPAELTDPAPMALMRILNRKESDGWQEVRNGPPAPEPPRSLYLSMEQIAGADIC
jgi:hypothetical protein